MYDIRYRARREEVPLRTAYSQYMSNSGLGGNERTIVKKKLFGDGPMKENFVADIENNAREAIADTLVKVFVGEDLTSPKKYKVRVTDKSGRVMFVWQIVLRLLNYVVILILNLLK